ncbi:Ephrin type-A receptor 5 [Nymphon striatum]|nr:Ephrin type-A receptor 5 [Nymphon striatum]KAG1684094.1 Ephrin type-A receptor 5 [Nymphon striatum]
MGGRGDIGYTIKCDACEKHVRYEPGWNAIRRTRVRITGLNPLTTYRFQVLSQNGVSNLTGSKKFVDIKVTTDAYVYGVVRNLRIISVLNSEITLAWDAPPESSSEAKEYEIKYFPRGVESISNKVYTKKEQHTVANLRQRTEYAIQVRARTESGWGGYSAPIYEKTGQMLVTGTVTNVRVTSSRKTSIDLAWDAPIQNFPGQMYEVRYYPSAVESDSTSQHVNEQKFTLQNLRRHTEYGIQVRAKTETGWGGYSTPIFQETGKVIARSIFSNLKVISIQSDQVTLAWDPPSDAENSVETYEIRYFPRGIEKNASLHDSKIARTTISKLKEKTEYAFQVRAKTNKGWGAYSPLVYEKTGQFLGEFVGGARDENEQTRIIVGVVVAVIFVVFLVIGVFVFCLRRGSDDCNKKQPSDCDKFDYKNGEVTTPLFTQCGGVRSYIDPHTYEDPNQAIREFTKEIDAVHIKIEAIIGGGMQPNFFYIEYCLTPNPLDPSAPDMTQFTSVEEWLNSIKMARYLENFERAGITTIDKVPKLSSKDLNSIGICLAGHQKKIMNSIQTMRAQMSEGFLV